MADQLSKMATTIIGSRVNLKLMAQRTKTELSQFFMKFSILNIWHLLLSDEYYILDFIILTRI